MAENKTNSPKKTFAREPKISIEHIQNETTQDWVTLVTVEHGIAVRTFEHPGKLSVSDATDSYRESKWLYDLTETENAAGYSIGVLSQAGWIEGHAPFNPIVDKIKDFPAENRHLTTWEIEAIHQGKLSETYSLGFAALVWAIEEAGLIYEPVWYAAQVVRHFLGPEDAHFVAGYLFRELTMRHRYEVDTMRGQKTKASASSGGQIRAAGQRKRADKIICVMTQYIENGKNISDAARFAHTSGYGTSMGANLKLYQRHSSTER